MNNRADRKYSLNETIINVGFKCSEDTFVFTPQVLTKSHFLYSEVFSGSCEESQWSKPYAAETAIT